MLEHSSNRQVIELIQELASSNAVYFDGERTALVGDYADQVSAYRAKKIWIETLKIYFLLEGEKDLSFWVDSEAENRSYKLHCQFNSACARYAFWRLTNEQAPEAQYIIETAHIPNCELRRLELQSASDLCGLGNSTPKDSFQKIEHCANSLGRVLMRLLRALR